MRTITKAALALALVGTAAIAAPTPGAAQVYYSGPGLSVYVGPSHYRTHRHRYYRSYGYYPRRHYYRSYGDYPRQRYSYRGCPYGYTVQDGYCKPYRGY